MNTLTFGGWLKRRRGGMGLTQKALAQQVGYAEVTLRKVEADELRPSRQMAEKLAEVLQIAPEEWAQFVRFARDEAGCDEVILSTQVSSARPDSTSHRRVPLERPSRAEHFQNRKAELSKLLANLQPGRVVTLCGPGGIGKSALAAEAVWHLAPSDQPPKAFPDGILFHSFYNQPQASLVLEHIARSFGEEPKPTPRDAAQRVIADRRFLLILDGAEEADDLRQVLDVRNQCGVLVTSRQRKDAIAERQDIAPLPSHEAVTLLQVWGGVRAADKSAVACISELAGRLPLALRLVGRYLAQNEEQAQDYLAWLAETPLAALDQGQRREESVPVLLVRSLAQVSKQARQVMEVIGLLALAPFTCEPIAAALDLPVVNVRRALGELVNYGLLMRPTDAYEVTHALIHTYARLKLSTPTEVVDRLTEYYIALANKYQSNWRKLDSQRPHVMALLCVLSEYQNWSGVITLVQSIDNYLDLQGHWTNRITALKFGLTAARAQQAYHAESVYLDNLGSVYFALGQYQRAIEYYRQALALQNELTNRQGEGISLGNLGRVHEFLGQYQRAIEYYEQALVIHQEIADRQGEGTNLGNLGNTYRELGQYQRAIEYYEQALTVSREMGDSRRQGHRLGNLGLTYFYLGRYRQALEYYEQALIIHRELADRPGEGTDLGNMGLAYHKMGQYQQALEYYEQALTIHQEIGNRYNEKIWLDNLGSVYRNLGQYQQALKYHEQTLTISREIGDCQGEGISLSHLGNTYRELGHYQQALEYLEQALVISREIGDRRREGIRLGDLGCIYRELGQYQRALEYHEQALAIHREIGNRQGEGTDVGNLGLVYHRMGQPEQAIMYIEQGLQIAYEIEDLQNQAFRLRDLGSIYCNMGHIERAQHYWNCSLHLLKKIKSPHIEQVRRNLEALDKI